MPSLQARAASSCLASSVPVILGQAEAGTSRAICIEADSALRQEPATPSRGRVPDARPAPAQHALTDSYPERRTILQRELASAQAALNALGRSGVARGGASAAQAHRVRQDIESLRREIARLQ